jgi:hypothetical protein
MLRSLFNALMDFAAEKWASEYTTGSPRHHLPLLGLSDDEAARSIGLGGASLGEQLSCNAPAADFARDDFKAVFHGRENDR